MENEIKLNQIGVIHTSYKDPKGMPIQGKFKAGVMGSIEVFPQYQQGLKDIEEFSHLILLYHLNRAAEERLVAKPFLEDEPHGIFAMRSPMRPNRIGLSVVKLENVERNIILFSEVDILDGTPLLDIKPYVQHFDHRDNVKSGWYERHFINGQIPKRTILG